MTEHLGAGDFTESDQRIIHAIQKLAHARLSGRTAQVTAAVVDFENNADKHIHDQLKDFSGNTEFTFGTVVDTLMHTIGAVLVPEVEFGKVLFDKAKDILITGLKEAVVGAEQNGKDAAERLQSAVKALSYEISNRDGIASATLEHEVDQLVIDHFDEFGQLHEDDSFYAEVCDRMGFTEPNRENVYDPIRQWLEYEFIGLLITVRSQLEQDHGYDDIHPQLFGLEAQRMEREEYEQHTGRAREAAWEDPYKFGN